MPSDLVYKYKARPTREQHNDFQRIRRGKQYLLNTFTGERFEYIDWQQQYFDPCLPAGVWQSEYWQDTKVVKDLDANTRQLEKLLEERLALLGFDQSQQEKRGKLDEKIEKKIKTIDSLKKKKEKVAKKDYTAEHHKMFGAQLKCDLACSVLIGDVSQRDTEYGKYPIHSENHVDMYSQLAKLAAKHPESLTAEPIITSSGEVIDLGELDATFRQQTGRQVEQTFKRWTTPDTNGNYSGKPRFKSFDEVNSFTVPNVVDKNGNANIRLENIQVDKKGKTIKQQYRNKYAELRVPNKISKENIRLVFHRPLPEGAKICSATFVHEADGWYVCLGLQLADRTKPKKREKKDASLENTVGFDAVLHEDVFLAGSNNTKYGSYKHYRKSQKLLAKLQKQEKELEKLALKLRFGGYRTSWYPEELHKKLGRIRSRIKKLHQKISRQRKHFHYQVAHHIARQPEFLYVVLEDLKIKNLTKRNKAKKNEDGSYAKNGQNAKSGLAKSWLDAGFYQFSVILENVLKQSGKALFKVPAAYTSKVLAYRDEMPFTDCDIRCYWDEVLQILVDRDCNSGANLVRKLLNLFPSISKDGKVFTKTSTKKTADYFQKLAEKEVALVVV